tara:strand:- start:331 stop:639 length:309 start_codon:yes stop_codon:yes gene_type:complete
LWSETAKANGFRIKKFNSLREIAQSLGIRLGFSCNNHFAPGVRLSILKPIFVYLFLPSIFSPIRAEKIPVLIVDGQNNHDWISTTDSLYATLQASNRFKLQV